MLYKLDYRNRKAVINICIMLIAKIISMIISLLYIPLLLNGMNSENYGIWLTLTSIISWVSMFDIGLGNGLRNKVAVALANNNNLQAKKYISTAYISINGCILILSILFLCIHPLVDWTMILNASNIETRMLNHLVCVVFICFCLQFSLNIINSILYALQAPSGVAILALIIQITSYISVLITIKVFSSNSILIIGSIISIIPPIVYLIVSIYLFKKKYHHIAPSFKYFDKKAIHDILSIGIKFFIIQIITIILFQSNNLIITHIAGNNAVVEYNIAYKYMQTLLLIYTIIVTPYWSATTEAYTRGDTSWIKKSVRKLEIIGYLTVVIGVIMTIISQQVYHLWIGDNITINITTTSILLIYSAASIFYSCYGFILNGIGKLKIQLIITAFIAIIYIPMAIYMGNIYGLNGILAIFALTAIINALWSKIQFYKIINNRATGWWNQ